MSDKPTEQERERAAWALLQAQIQLAQRQSRWEPWKALAALVAAATLFAGGVLTVASWWHPTPQTINVRIEGTLPH